MKESIQLPASILAAMGKLSLARSLEEEAKDLRRQATDTLIYHMEDTNIKKCIDAQGNSVTYIAPSTRKSVNSTKAKEELINRGLPANVIAECFTEATTVTPTAASVRYTPHKKKEN